MMICDPHQDQDAGLCYKKCDKKYQGVGPVCWADCPAGWHDCGAACARNQGECASKVIDMVFAPLTLVANVAGAVVSFGGSAVLGKAVATATKVTKVVQKSLKIGHKVASMANKIATAAQAKGQQMTQAEAEAMAEQNVETAHENLHGGDTEADWEKAIDAVEMADPTGAMSAAKAFIHPLCSQFH